MSEFVIGVGKVRGMQAVTKNPDPGPNYGWAAIQSAIGWALEITANAVLFHRLPIAVVRSKFCDKRSQLVSSISLRSSTFSTF